MSFYESMKDLLLTLGLRSKNILVIGTNDQRTLKYLSDRLGYDCTPGCKTHANTRLCCTKMIISELKKNDLLGYLQNKEYDEVVLCSKYVNCKRITDFLGNSRLVIVPY